MKMNIGKLERKGKNLYEDRSGRLFIYSKKDNCVYMIGKEKLKQFSIYQSRFIIPIVLLILIGYYLSWTIAVCVAIIAYLIFEITYRHIFLKDLTVLNPSVLPEDKNIENRYLTDNKLSNVLRTLVALVFVVLLIINFITQNPNWNSIKSYINDPDNIFLLVATIFCIILAMKVLISSLIAFIKQIKRN